MTVEIGLMLALVATAMVLFARETLPLEVTALGLLGVLLATGILDLGQALSGLSNPAVVAIASLLVLSQALLKTGLVERLADALAARATHRPGLGLGLLLAVVAVLSGFLNNTAVVAIFIPLVMSVAARLQMSPSRLLIPLSYAAILGGTLTLIGTSTNLLVSSLAAQSGVPPIGMFEMTPLACVFLVCGLLYLGVTARRLLPEHVAPGAPAERYRMGPYLTEVRVEPESPLIGQTCREARLGERCDVNVLAILRGSLRYFQEVGTVPLVAGDVLLVQGAVDDLLALRKDLGVSMLPEHKLAAQDLVEGDQITAEVLIPPSSRLVGRSLAQADFRHLFGAFVMAIRHHGATLRQKVARSRLRPWDALLVLLPRNRLDELRRSPELLVLSEVEQGLERPRLWWLVLLVLPAAILLAATGVLDIAGGALLGAILLLVVGVLRPTEVYRRMSWSVLLLIAAFVPVGQAFAQTGTADYLAGGLLAAGQLVPQSWQPLVLLALFYLASSLLTEIVSNSAAAIVLVPIALSLSAALGVEARPFLIAVCFAASASFMTPMGYQTNMMVYSPGGYRFADYLRIGAPLNLLFWILASLLIPLWWPL